MLLTLARVMWAGIFIPSRESLIHSPAKQRGFSPLQKEFFPFCKGIPLPLTWHGPLYHLVDERGISTYYYAMQITIRLGPVQIVNFFCFGWKSQSWERQIDTKCWIWTGPSWVGKLFAKHFITTAKTVNGPCHLDFKTTTFDDKTRPFSRQL
jgi:hypothetical protein